ncbi:MAG: glutathione-dependent formaldehyde dehydrogenase [Mucilaginibacter sp.]|nr:glutathione-dependent formaldehyde dehydrogenase [Mucilaginibacter sp.]
MLAMNYRGPYRVRTVQNPCPRFCIPEDAIVRVSRTCSRPFVKAVDVYLRKR